MLVRGEVHLASVTVVVLGMLSVMRFEVIRITKCHITGCTGEAGSGIGSIDFGFGVWHLRVYFVNVYIYNFF